MKIEQLENFSVNLVNIDPGSAILNLIIGYLISIIIKVFYDKYSNVLDASNKISELFPLITTTTVLVITIVKSSLALSLGLVGALSIVRFRTPIKDPRDLGYLFLSIGVGIGLGANQTMYTIIATFFIFLLLGISHIFKSERNSQIKNFNLTISWKKNIDYKINTKNIDLIKDILSKSINSFEIKRIDITSENSEVLIFLKVDDYQKLKNIIFNLQKNIKNSEISFVDEINFPVL